MNLTVNLPIQNVKAKLEEQRLFIYFAITAGYDITSAPRYEMCSPHERNIVNLNPSIANITLRLLWIPSRILPDNGDNVKRNTCTCIFVLNGLRV